MTFYFDIDNFTDRAMVVLTTMLVIATITSSIESVILFHSNCMINFNIISNLLGIADNFILQID